MLNIKDLLPIFSRGVVYLLGFISVFVISHVLGRQDFGAYSVIQSYAEMCVLIIGFGSYQAFARVVIQKKKNVTLGDVFYSLFFGSFLFAAFFLVLFFRNDLFDSVEIAIPFIMGVFSYSLILMILSIQRGYGQTWLLNIEFAIRSGLILLCIALFFIANIEISLKNILIFVVVSYFFVLILSVCQTKLNWIDFKFKTHIDFKERVHLLFSSVMGFMTKKSDLIVFSMFVPLTHIAAYKIAFLVAEAPSQFVQAFFVSKTKDIAKRGGYDKNGISKHFQIRGIALGLFLTSAVSVFLYFSANYFSYVDHDVISIYMVMLPYFIVRCYTLYQEIYLMILAKSEHIRNRTFIELLIKAALFVCAFLFYREAPEFIYVVLVFLEVLVFEFSVKYEFGYFPILSLIRGSAHVGE